MLNDEKWCAECCQLLYESWWHLRQYSSIIIVSAGMNLPVAVTASDGKKYLAPSGDPLAPNFFGSCACSRPIPTTTTATPAPIRRK